MTELPPAPRWLAEEEWLRSLLHWFVDRLDAPRERAVTRRISSANVPALYRFNEDTRYRWQLIEELAELYKIFEIRYEDINSFDERYHAAQLRLDINAEPLLRQWLQRPRVDPMLAEWRGAISQLANRFVDGGTSLHNLYLQAPGFSSTELAEAFATVGEYLDQQLSLREIAARCFRGDSKFLDYRQDLLLRLFGTRANNILPRPLLLTAFAPFGFKRLLIVENQDSFLRLVDQRPFDIALLYSGGFRASASRLLSEHTQFAYLPGSDENYFASHWRDAGLPTEFWGDLDYSGLSILAALRQSIPHLCAWKNGYVPMLKDLVNGGGHLPEQASKSAQIDPQNTGCFYTDTELLPAIRQSQRFIDQEAYMPDMSKSN